MRTPTTRTPTWVIALLVVFGAGVPAWGLVVRHDRMANQARLAAIASLIAGRPVQVRCPGMIAKLGPDTVAGSVQADADGNPRDETKLAKVTCAELDALAEGRRAPQLACVARSSSCGDDAQRLAWAVDALAHESYHLRGVLDEGVAECSSMQTVDWTAQRLGATPAQARGLAQLHFETGFPQMPDRYQAPGCSDGGALDLRPGTPVWP